MEKEWRVVSPTPHFIAFSSHLPHCKRGGLCGTLGRVWSDTSHRPQGFEKPQEVSVEAAATETETGTTSGSQDIEQEGEEEPPREQKQNDSENLAPR